MVHLRILGVLNTKLGLHTVSVDKWQLHATFFKRKIFPVNVSGIHASFSIVIFFKRRITRTRRNAEVRLASKLYRELIVGLQT